MHDQESYSVSEDTGVPTHNLDHHGEDECANCWELRDKVSQDTFKGEFWVRFVLNIYIYPAWLNVSMHLPYQ